MPICIAGMHRAGTSMVARLLEGSGLDLGGPANFAPPAPDNRDGYWEDLRLVALNDRILDRFQGAWDHPPILPKGWEASAAVEPERRDASALAQTRSEPWGWKDPRNSLTVPFWRRCSPGSGSIVCLRNPLEVADSLRARGYTSERFGLALWESYHRAIEENVDSSFGLVTHYESFLADPRAELERVLGFSRSSPSAAVREAVLAAASPGARHQRRTSAEVEASSLEPRGQAASTRRCATAAGRIRAAPPAAAGRPASGPAPRRGRAARAGRAARRAQGGPRGSRGGAHVPQAGAGGPHEEVDSVKRVLAARDEHLARSSPCWRRARARSTPPRSRSRRSKRPWEATRARLAEHERLARHLEGRDGGDQEAARPRR
jgi:hypothetical protein